jgi:hypothetical protein
MVSSAWSHKPCPSNAKGAKGPNLAKPKLALFVGVFHNCTLTWLPRVTKRTSLGMKLNLQVF